MNNPSPVVDANHVPPPSDPAFVHNPTITARGVSIWFGQKVAVSELSCSFGPGLTGLLGPNGAGKTTFMRALVGLTAVNEGTIEVNGVDPHRDRSVHRTLSLVPEDDAVPAGLTARQLVAYSAALHRVSDPSSVDAAIATVGLTDVSDRVVTTFSKGMRQRTKIAAALVTNPSILVLDEPLNGADPVQRHALVHLFTSLSTSGRTVIVSSHVLHEVEQMASRVVVMINGRLAAAGDYHGIRDAMADTPRRIRVRSDQSRTLASKLVTHPSVVRVGVDGNTIEIATLTARTLALELPRIAAEHNITLREVQPLDDSLEAMFQELVR